MVYRGEGRMKTTATTEDRKRAFTRLVMEVEPRLSYAFAAAYGPDVGADVTSEALAWAWEHWDRVARMQNPAGYLYRVGQSKARWYHRPHVLFPSVAPPDAGELAPELPDALEKLTKQQRVAVLLVHGLGYSEREVADLLGLSRWSVRTHANRGLARLRSALGVMVDA